jgi:hypothetical protein
MHGGRSARWRTTPAMSQEATTQAKAMDVVGAVGVATLHRGRSSNKPTGDECQRYGKMGHWACECRSKSKKEQAHITQDEEVGSLLLVTTTLTHS